MMKKEYKKPTIKVVGLQQQSPILTGSMTMPPVIIVGLDPDPILDPEPPIIFDENGEIPGNAW